MILRPTRFLHLLPALALTVVLCGCLATPIVRSDDSAATLEQSRRMQDEIAAVADTGDWLVIRGYHATDNLVANATGLPLSHVAIYDAATGATIEADGTGVHESDLAHLVGRAHRVLVIRPRWRTGENAEAALREARSHVGQRYDFLGTVGLDNSERFYCSELVVGAYRAWFTGREQFPAVIKPGEMYLYGAVAYDSMDRNERADAGAAP